MGRGGTGWGPCGHSILSAYAEVRSVRPDIRRGCMVTLVASGGKQDGTAIHQIHEQALAGSGLTSKRLLGFGHVGCEPVDPLQTRRQKHVLEPGNGLSALPTIGEEGSLHGAGKRHEEGVELLFPTGR